MITRYTGDSFSGQRSAIGKYSSAVNKMADTRTAIAKLKIEQEEDENRRKVRLMLFQQLMKIGEHVGERLEKRSRINRGLEEMGAGQYKMGWLGAFLKMPKPGEEIGDTGIPYNVASMFGAEGLTPDLKKQLEDTYLIER